MTPNEAKISALVGLWYRTIGPLHHKDRDCHFRISRHWKYAGELTYEIEHNGYLLDDHNREYATQEQAEQSLIAMLKIGIETWLDSDDSNYTPEERKEILTASESL